MPRISRAVTVPKNPLQKALETIKPNKRHRRSGRLIACARLWNAKERIDSGRVVEGRPQNLRVVLNDEENQSWKQLVSDDVTKFIEDARLLPEERRKCVQNPNRYFSFPNNVPTALRKQVYFPQFNITFRRTPNLPPKYAAFDVPLWFNKLDMKDYLKSAYGVEVLHVRSTVIQAKVRRRDAMSPYTNGQLYRPASWKKMTVELVEPFVWPDAEDDLSPWETNTYYDGMEYALESNRRRSETAASQPNQPHRKSIAQQAKELLAGKTTWKPTWESLPTDSRVLKPFDPKKLGSLANTGTASR